MRKTRITFDLPTFIFGSFISALALGLLAVVVEIYNGKI
jgi:hypothetical protein|tara:strand:+ start:128 stop:244 length:117 start_codon:yes stop_codon:yes gene_type:complete